MGEWKLQDAKNQFSAVVDAAIAGEPQHVTRRGKPAVVVLGSGLYRHMCQMAAGIIPNFDETVSEASLDGADVVQDSCRTWAKETWLTGRCGHGRSTSMRGEIRQ